MISNRILRSSRRAASDDVQLTEHEWMVMHDVLLKRSSSAVPSSVGVENKVWKSRRNRTKTRFNEYRCGKVKVDWLICELLKKAFTQHQLKRFGGIFAELISAASSGSSPPDAAGTSSAPSGGDAPGGLDPPNGSHGQQQLSSLSAPFLDSADDAAEDTSATRSMYSNIFSIIVRTL